MITFLLRPFRLCGVGLFRFNGSTIQRFNALLFRVLLSLACLAVSPVKAEVGEAERLVAVIRSASATAEQKEDACWRLKRVGTATAVPALATLLSHEHLYQAACDALETMPFPEADQVLMTGLNAASANAKAGIIHALGVRKNSACVPTVATLLNNADPLIAEAAANALGKIGGGKSVAALQGALKSASVPRRSALVNALLQCAGQMVGSDNKSAAAIYKQFDSSSEQEHVRAAAFAGLVRTAGDKSLDLIIGAIRGNDPAHQISALQFARTVQNEHATETLTNLLAKSPPPMQAALMEVLQQRDDPRAVPAVAGLMDSPTAYVRVAAIAALGTLGDATMVPRLASAATSQDQTERAAARRALLQLHRGNIGAALVQELAPATPDKQSELALALAGRHEKSAVPLLFQTARSQNETTRATALRALSVLAETSHLGGLITLLVEAQTDAQRRQIEGVLEALVDRQEGRKQFDVSPLLQAMNTPQPETRATLLHVSALFIDDGVRGALRSNLKDGNPLVRVAAERALCASRDPAVIPDLLTLARSTEEVTSRALALEGYVRLVRDDRGGHSPSRRLEMLKPAYDLATRAAERKMVLSGLASVPHRGALDIASNALADAEVKPEAEAACIQIAKGLLASDAEAAELALRRVAESTSNPGAKESAQALLAQLDSGWLCAGPYRQATKRAQELFHIAFPPEQAGAEVAWHRAPASTNASRRGEVVLDGVVGGNDCVMYLKTRVFAPKEQLVSFGIGSDDGIKLWLNKELVHSNNVLRPLIPDQDHAKGVLRQGWNDLFAKVTQNNLGCGMMLKIKGVDGSEVAGLKFNPSGK